MARIVEIERDYSMDDLQMLQRAQIFHNGFVVDENDFENMFPVLADPFATEFQTAINEADAIPSGSEVRSQMKYLTEQLNDLMSPARKLMQMLFTYADWAWESKAKTEEFGRQVYGKVKDNHEKMKEVLEQGHRNAIVPANNTGLTSVGMPVGLPAEIETMMNDMDTLIVSQQDMKAGQKTKSEVRVKAYNKVWGFMQKINQASKVVFEDSPARVEFYLLYPGANQSLPKPQGLNAAYDGVNPTDAVLTWDPVPDAESYKIYYSEANIGQQSGSFAEIAQVGNVNIYTLPLVPNKTNFWKIKAYGGGLTSSYSDEVSLDGAV